MMKFTIITCTYNAESVCERTFESVREQTYPGVEHLILDGKSKDGTVAIASAYKKRSEEENPSHDVAIVSEPDKGLYDAMNKGILLASGDYLVFLNAGDVFPAGDTLELMARCVDEKETLPGVLYGDTDVVDDEGHFLRHRRLTPPDHLSWRSFRQGMLVCHQAFYVRTDLAKMTLYNLSYRYSADVDWCIRIMKEAERKGLPLKNVHQVVVNYLDGGMSIKNHRVSLKERFAVMRSHYGLFQTLCMHVWFVLRAVMKK